MRHALLAGMALLLALGCAAPPEPMSLQPLPENGQVLPYAELLTRARAQARKANDAFYLDRWGDLEDLAKGLEQTARFLSKASEVPAKNKDVLAEVTGDLAKNAIKLKEAAVAKNVKDATEAMRQINVNVRQLRLTD